LLENQHPIFRADFDFFARLEIARQRFRRERIEQVVLNRVCGKLLEVLVLARVTNRLPIAASEIV